jgi:hypothetical protein
MDELTRERYPFHLPAREAHAPAHWSPEEVAVHRIVLCGTDDLSVPQQGAGGGRPNRLAMHRRLVKAIRRYST